MLGFNLTHAYGVPYSDLSQQKKSTVKVSINIGGKLEHVSSVVCCIARLRKIVLGYLEDLEANTQGFTITKFGF